MSSSVQYFWNTCPEWLFQWFIGGSFYVVVCIWSFIEFLRIIIKLSRVKQAQLFKQENQTKSILSGMNSITHKNSDDFANSYNFNLPFNKPSNTQNKVDQSKTKSSILSHSTLYPMAKTNTSHNTDLNSPLKIRIFGSRSSQKAFLIVIFFQSLFRSIECLSIAFIKNISDSKDTNCSMSVIDSVSAHNSLWYTYCESLGALLFPMAFSCLAYQLAKIYYRFNYESISLQYAQSSIYTFLYALITLNMLCFCGTFALIFWIQFGTFANDATLQTYMIVLYGIMCIVLSLCYARFAFPIYKMYRRIMIVLNNQKKVSNVPSFKSLEDGMDININSPQIAEDERDALPDRVTGEGSLLYSDYCDIYQRNSARKKGLFVCCLCVDGRIANMEQTYTEYSSVASENHLFYAQFIASMKRIWITACVCGIAFLLRAIILLVPPVTDWYEKRCYAHALYSLLLEILPIFAMLYIYGNATKSIGKI